MSVRPGNNDAFFRRASLSVVGLCTAVLIATLAAISYRPSGGTAVATGYGIGEQLDVLHEWGGTEGDTLVVFLKSDCPASAAFAEQLADRFSTHGLRMHARAVVPDELREREAMLATAAGFERSAIEFVDFRRLKLQVVPSLVVVDREGRVKLERAGLPAVAEALTQIERAPGT